ncbi:heme-binding domain-containing protein [Sulfurimonas sp.]
MKKIILVLIVLLLLIQFIPYGRDHSNPKVINEPDWDSPKTRELFMRACGNCHSNETKWPIYSNIAPVSWLVMHDVQEGREHLNISNWLHQKKNKGNEAAEELRDGEMPPLIYMPTHPEARLSNEEKKTLIQGLINTFGEDK